MTLAGREGGFDLVLCDPPKFAPSKSAKQGALGAYQKLCAAAFRLAMVATRCTWPTESWIATISRF